MLCYLAREVDLCNMMHESFNVEHTLVSVLMSYGQAVNDPITQVVCFPKVLKLDYLLLFFFFTLILM
jgi:hypothetical protein